MTQQSIATEWNDTFIMKLPQELFSKTMHYLSKDDLIECACVSEKWHIKVQPLLYRSLELTDRHRFKRFHKLVEESTRTTKRQKLSTTITMKPRIHDIGDYIYALKLGDGILTTNMMQQLAIQCPYVRKIHFFWNGTLPEPTTPHRVTRAFRNPLTFLEHFQPSNLVQLTLSCTLSKLYSLSTIADALRHTAQLQCLELEVLVSITVRDMEQLHAQLPGLIHLCINVAQVQVDDASLSECETILSARRMQSLTFLSDVWNHPLVLDSLWFRYILRKYSRLNYLALYHSDRLWGRRESVNQSTPAMPIVMLRDHFPELQTVHLDMFAGQSIMTWPDLVKDIPRVKLCGADKRGVFSDWIKSDATNRIEHLVLPTLPITVSQVSHCIHIKHLELNGHFPRGAEQILPIGTILSECKALEAMIVSYCTIHYSRVPIAASNSKSPLRTLRLEDTLLLTHDALAYIGIQCPQLTHVRLERCAWGMRANEPIIRIHMPQQWFAYFEIVEPKIFSEYGKIDDTPFQQAGYVPLNYYNVTNEYLVVKTPAKACSMGISSLMYNAINWLNPFNMLNMWYKGDLWTKHRLQLFHISRSNRRFRSALTKIANFNIKSWSDFLISDGSSNRARAEDLASLDKPLLAKTFVPLCSGFTENALVITTHTGYDVGCFKKLRAIISAIFIA
ncbi:hypothetical protein BJV82DRAFT_577855 [Fennellomyces sp. T-0311]|nr:hypothetical protein BJV82DRAFT_577855 [Fennellomyces sp. T-0311]